MEGGLHDLTEGEGKGEGESEGEGDPMYGNGYDGDDSV